MTLLGFLCLRLVELVESGLQQRALVLTRVRKEDHTLRVGCMEGAGVCIHYVSAHDRNRHSHVQVTQG